MKKGVMEAVGHNYVNKGLKICSRYFYLLCQTWLMVNKDYDIYAE
jgi:hypothetical protein